MAARHRQRAEAHDLLPNAGRRQIAGWAVRFRSRCPEARLRSESRRRRDRTAPRVRVSDERTVCGVAACAGRLSHPAPDRTGGVVRRCFCSVPRDHPRETRRIGRGPGEARALRSRVSGAVSAAPREISGDHAPLIKSQTATGVVDDLAEDSYDFVRLLNKRFELGVQQSRPSTHFESKLVSFASLSAMRTFDRKSALLEAPSDSSELE